jgi:2TM family of unknown function (DUF5676)
MAETRSPCEGPGRSYGGGIRYLHRRVSLRTESDYAVGPSWAHAINLEAIKPTAPMFLGGLILGLISWVLAAWIVGYAVGVLYNLEAKTFSKRTETRKHGPATGSKLIA